MKKWFAIFALAVVAAFALGLMRHRRAPSVTAVAAAHSESERPPALNALRDAVRFAAEQSVAGALSGKVVGPGSAGAQVAIRGAGVQRVAIAAADGAYRFDGLGPGSYWLDATSGALAAETLGPVPLGRDEELAGLDLKLVQTGGLAGQVLDARTQAPLAGARLAAGGASATTDQGGDFVLHGLPPGQATLVVSHPGYVPSTTQLAVPRNTVMRGARLLLGQAAHVSGRVQQSDGTPVAGAPVFAERYDFGPVAADTPLGTTDAKGQFAGDLAPGEVTVRATAPNGEARSAVLELHAGESSAKLVLVVDIGGDVDGKVLEPSGGPALTASVYAVEVASQRMSRGAPVSADGHFHLAGLPAGVYAVIARDGARSAQRAGIRLGPGETAQVEIRFGTASIEGRVLDAAGAPLVGARVAVAPEGGSAVAETGVESGAGGAFKLEGLSGARFTLRATVPEGSAELHGVAAGATGVELRVAAQSQIAGSVFDDQGQPVTDFQVVADPAAPASADAVQLRRVTGRFAAVDGRFLLSCAPGRYRVRVAAAGYESTDAGEVVAPPSGTSSEVQVRLPRHSRSITGTVVEAQTLRPVAGARVATSPDLLYAFGRADAFHTGSSAVTDASGAFSLDAQSGAVNLFATADGHGWARPVHVPADASDPVQIQLPVGQNEPADFAGVGMQIAPGFTVARVFEGGPADLAGLRGGDVLVSIDGNPVAGRSLGEVVGWIRGEVGTAVAIEVQRSGQVLTLTPTRAEVRF